LLTAPSQETRAEGAVSKKKSKSSSPTKE